jgi:hypothetical protein
MDVPTRGAPRQLHPPHSSLAGRRVGATYFIRRRWSRSYASSGRFHFPAVPWVAIYVGASLDAYRRAAERSPDEVWAIAG